jgi:transposase-like protein
MMENGKSRKRRQLSPEEKWEIFLEVTSQEISQADAARKWRVDVSVIIRLRALAKDAALAAFASARPGRPADGSKVALAPTADRSERPVHRCIRDRHGACSHPRSQEDSPSAQRFTRKHSLRTTRAA